MSLHYLLDGYNITKQIPSSARKKLKGERDSLIRLIEIYRPQGSLANKVTVVFDGKPGICNPHLSKSVRIVFSENETGDDKIRSIISASTNKKNIIAVTDDKELRFSIRALGAKVIDVKEFLAKIDARLGVPKLKTPQKKSPESKKNISKMLEYKINEEMARIWLAKKRKR